MNIFNSSFILSEKRYRWIDYDKGISIILVAYGHCLGILRSSGANLDADPAFNYLALFLYGFRMPLFFIISGVFVMGSLKRKGLGGYVYGRLNNILYPLFIWGVIEVSMQLLSNHARHQPANWGDYLYLLLDPRRLGTGHFWYLNALFTIGALYAIFNVVLRFNRVVQLVLGVVLYGVSAYIHLNNLQFGILTDICQYYFFFSLGAFTSPILLEQRNMDRFATWKVLIPLLIIFLGMQYYITNINLTEGKGEINYAEHHYPLYYLIEALIGCTLSVNVSFLLQKYDRAKFIRIIGYYSLFIYVMQIIVMIIASIVLMRVLKISNVPVLIAAVLFSGTIIPIVIYNICLRLNLWWLFTFRKPVKEMASLRPRPAVEEEQVVS